MTGFNNLDYEEHDFTNNAKKVNIVAGSVGNSGNVTLNPGPNFIGLVTAYISNTVGNATLNPSPNFIGLVTAVTYNIPYSYYAQSSLVSGYVYHGLAVAGSNPTTAVFRIQRESLNTGEILFADGTGNFTHNWSSASLASVAYS